MDEVLIARWIGGLEAVPILDAASVSVARERARALAAELGMGAVESGSLVIVVSELATNQLRHARRGAIALRPIDRAGVAGIEVVAADAGEGLADPAGALDGGSGGSGGLGAGVSGVQRLADEVDFDIRLGQGTCVHARKFVRKVPRRREVGIFGRPCSGERVSGDDATFVRENGELLVALADGLGHGADAREPARRAIEIVRAGGASRGLTAMLGDADAALTGTRGAVMAIARLDEQAGTLSYAGLGNVAAQVWSAKGYRALAGASFVLGAPRRVRELARETSASIVPHEPVVLFSDGLRARDVHDPALLRKHPIVIAQRMLERLGRANDDATVLVAA